jgi:hypothetical protein
MSEPLRILILAANPRDTSRLALETEHRLLRNKMRANAQVGNCEMLFEWAARLTDLKDALAGHRPHVIHFAGHGTPDGICLEDNEGRSSSVTKAQLAQLFKSSGEHLRLVVLNACFSAQQAEAINESVDYVVGTNAAVADDAAVVFAAYFYEALAVGSTVRDAYNKAQGKLTSVDQRVVAEQYELLVRSGTDEGKPLLPPFQPNTLSVQIGEHSVDETVFANVIEEGPGNASSAEPEAPNERNVLDVRIEKQHGKTTTFANRIRR